MSLLEKLNACNDVPVFSVEDKKFATYGRILKGYDVSEWLAFMREKTQIPDEGNVYVPSVEELEAITITEEIKNTVYGGMPIQVGYCNGKNTTYNGFEYHKGSEINVAVCDFMLALGHSYEIVDNTYDVSQAEVFFVPQGTVIEMYQTTLHLSPLRVTDEGFRDIVVLPRGTNTPLETKQKHCGEDEEQALLLQKNKWVIAHPKRDALIRQGAYAGVTGENKELFYPTEKR